MATPAPHGSSGASAQAIAAEADTLTLTRFIMSRTRDPEMALLLNTIQLSCTIIQNAVRMIGVAGNYGLYGESNASGDDVKRLDVIADDAMVGQLVNSHCCAVLVSEEQENPIIVPKEKRGRYCVAFDPLDGSSNIDCNVSTGTIFGVWERLSPESEEPTVADILRPGRDLAVAGYCMYGSATELVISFGEGVERFTLDPSLGEFVHTGMQVQVPATPKTIYSINEGYSIYWDEAISSAVQSFKNPSAEGAKPYSLRYVGSMVSDVHRTLLYGGIFLYPTDRKNVKGKLRALYEGLPMAFIVEQAGGAATTGMYKGEIRDVLDYTPESPHDRVAIICGCTRDVNVVLEAYTNMPPPAGDASRST